MSMSTRIPVLRTLLVALVAVVALGACDSSPTDPTMAALAGEYRATTFTATVGDETINALALGVVVEIDLRADGTTTGRYFIPGELNEDDSGDDYKADLRGTWSLRGNTVTFDHSTDTPLTDVQFTVLDDSRLEADDTLADGTRIRIVLQPR